MILIKYVTCGVSDKSKGFGFVTYRTIAETDACIKQKKTEEGHVLSEKTIEVKRAIPKEFEPSQHEKSQRYLGCPVSNYILTIN